MTYPGAPSIYYGDEIGMQGGHDPANRGAFPWHKPETWDTELLHEFQRLISLRRTRPSLRRGTFQILHAVGDLFAHARQLDDETVIVVFNTARSHRRLDLVLQELIPDGTIFENVWTHEGSHRRARHASSARSHAPFSLDPVDGPRFVTRESRYDQLQKTLRCPFTACHLPGGFPRGSTSPCGSICTRRDWPSRRTPTSRVIPCSRLTLGLSMNDSSRPAG